MNLAYLENIRSIDVVVARLRTERRPIFVGIIAPQKRGALVLQRIDDAAAEIAATMCAPPSPQRRR